MDFGYYEPFLITKPFKPQILRIHGESLNAQFLLPHPEQIKHLKQNQHLSRTSKFPYFNVEHKLGQKHCLLWSNSSRKNLNSDKRMDRRRLISFPQCKQHTAPCWLIFSKANSSSISNSKQTCRAWVFSGDPQLCPAN